jgi:hypothetical protein
MPYRRQYLRHVASEGAMEHEMTVHQDTTINTNKLTVVLSVGGIVALLTAGALYGTITAKVDTLQEDMRVMRVDMQSKEGKDAVALMFGDLRARLSRIESLLDQRTGTPSTQRMP